VGKNIPSLMNVMMQLRKICNHPFLIEGVEEKEREKVRASPACQVPLHAHPSL
jgi:chromodomain-helicase-DNA-binding protein 7